MIDHSIFFQNAKKQIQKDTQPQNNRNILRNLIISNNLNNIDNTNNTHNDITINSPVHTNHSFQLLNSSDNQITTDSQIPNPFNHITHPENNTDLNQSPITPLPPTNTTPPKGNFNNNPPNFFPINNDLKFTLVAPQNTNDFMTPHITKEIINPFLNDTTIM